MNEWYRVAYKCDACPHECVINVTKRNYRNVPKICFFGGFHHKRQQTHWKLLSCDLAEKSIENVGISISVDKAYGDFWSNISTFDRTWRRIRFFYRKSKLTMHDKHVAMANEIFEQYHTGD